MEDLLAGLAISFSFDIRLESPRPILADKTFRSIRYLIVIRRHLTEDRYYFRQRPADREIKFPQHSLMREYLMDSLVFYLAPDSVLPRDEKIRMSLDIAAKSLDPNEISSASESPGEADTLAVNGLNWFDRMFSVFVELIGYREWRYSLKSPLFKPSDLSSEAR